MNLWENVLNSLKDKINLFYFNHYISKLTFLGCIEDTIFLKGSDPYSANWILETFGRIIEDELFSLSGIRYKVEILVKSEKFKNKEEISKRDNIYSQLNFNIPDFHPNFTFENFIIGESNRTAFQAALEVAKYPSEKYNPLYIYGNFGLGKTHLLHGIGNYIVKNNKNLRVKVISSEMYVSELINAIRTKKIEEFREKYRTNCDILLIDDIHFLSSKEKSQEEFFHTFNYLYNTKKQIVITSTNYPHSLENMEEKLKSRFNWGLIVEIKPPEFDLRLQILLDKAKKRNIFLSDEIAKLISKNVENSIRDLEGVLYSIEFESKLYSKVPDKELVISILKRFGKELKDKKEITSNDILDIVSEHFNVNKSVIQNKRKIKENVYIRHIAMYLCRKFTPLSLTEIAHFFNITSHSAVINVLKKIEEEIKHNESLRKDIRECSDKVKNLLNNVF